MSFNFYQRRKALGLTLEDIGKKVGVSKSTVKKWESGYIKNMKRDKIALLATVLDVSPLDILFCDSPENIQKNTTPINTSTEALNDYTAFIKTAFSVDTAKNSLVLCTNNGLSFISLSKEKTQKLLELIEKIL